jgi:hypothetical protein
MNPLLKEIRLYPFALAADFCIGRAYRCSYLAFGSHAPFRTRGPGNRFACRSP